MKTEIRCETEKQFYDAVSELYYRSIQFTAEIATLTITLR